MKEDLICPHCLRATNHGGLKLFDAEDSGHMVCTVDGTTPINEAEAKELAKQLRAWVENLRLQRRLKAAK